MTSPQPRRAHTITTVRFYKRIRAFYLGLLAIIVAGPILWIFGSPLAVGLLLLGSVVGAFFFGISFGRMIETIGRRAQLSEASRRGLDESSERLLRPDDEEIGF